MDLRLTYWSKRENSTSYPTTFNWSITNAKLKDLTSVTNPTFIIDRAAYDQHVASYGAQYNYVYVPNVAATQDYPAGKAFSNRYYFVNDIRYNLATVEIDCSVDVLASYKTGIGNSRQYVLRSSSECTSTLPDAFYPAKGDISRHILTFESPWVSSFSAGTMVVGIVGVGATIYCGFTPGDFSKFVQFLFNPSTSGYCYKALGAMGLATNPEYKMVVDPLQYISSVIWIPQAYRSPTIYRSVPVGYATVDFAADCGIAGSVYQVVDPILNITRTFPLAKHTQMAADGSYGKYLNMAPWTRYLLSFPPFGVIELDSTMVDNMYNSPTVTQIHTIAQIDVRTGTATLYVQRRNSLYNQEAQQEEISAEQTLLKLNAQVGVTMQLGQVLAPGYGVTSAISSIGGVVSNALSGNVAGAFTAASAAIGDVVKSQIPQASTVGSTGGVDALRGDCVLTEMFLESVETDNTQHGRPLCKIKTINTLSGYILCMNAEIAAGATLDEKRQIIEYMNGGFFYE